MSSEEADVEEQAGVGGNENKQEYPICPDCGGRHDPFVGLDSIAHSGLGSYKPAATGPAAAGGADAARGADAPASAVTEERG
jgi:hypothetical protein